MIISLIHPGSGVGDQLFSYLATRMRALELGVDFGLIGELKADFLKLDKGKPVDLKYHIEYPAGKIVVDDEHKLYEGKLNYYDPEFNFIEDGTVIDGCILQDERYWDLEKVREWLKVEPLEMPDDVCVINFRGGEFSLFPDLFLIKEYWAHAIIAMYKIRLNMNFEVHTDDVDLATRFFPMFKDKIIHDVGLNWRSVRYAKYAIIANSAFGIIPRLLNGGTTIAPRYWARHNKKEWSMPQNYYKSFLYI